MSAKGQKVQVPNGADLIIQLVLWLGQSIATSPVGQADTLWLSSLCSQAVRKLSLPVRFSCLDNVHFQLLPFLWRTKMPWLGIFIFLFFRHTIGHLAIRSFMPLASWRDCIYLFIYFWASGQMATPISRSHCLSSHISVLAYPSSVRNIKTPPFPPAHPQIYLPLPKSVEENGCRACDVHNPRRHFHEVNGRSWLCMVQEVVVPPHHILCSWCTGLSHWIRAPVGDWKIRMNSTQLHQLAQPWWTVMFTNTSRNHELICCWHGWQPVFYYHKTDSRVVEFLTWTQLSPSYHRSLPEMVPLPSPQLWENISRPKCWPFLRLN